MVVADLVHGNEACRNKLVDEGAVSVILSEGCLNFMQVITEYKRKNANEKGVAGHPWKVGS